MILLELFGNPVPCGRPRFRRTGTFVQIYDPQEKLKEGYKWQIKSQFRETPIAVPVILDMQFFMPIPKSTSKAKRRQMLTGEIAHMVRPDLDNLQKFILDCLNDLVFEDDSQVIQISARKCYSDNPGTVLRIRTMNEFKRDLTNENYARSS